MKYKYVFIIVLLLPVWLTAQDVCKGYFAFEEGTSWTLTSYNKNKKKSGSTTYELLFNEEENGQQELTFTYETFDKDGEKLSAGEFSGTCAGNTFTTSFNGLSGESMPQTSDVEVEITGDFVQYPHQMTPGEKLPDAHVEIASKIENGMQLFKVSTDLTNRKVIGFEKVVTPAGTFDCVKISYDAKVKMILTKTMHVVEYLSAGIGIVRSEHYDKKGELAGYTEISMLKKG